MVYRNEYRHGIRYLRFLAGSEKDGFIAPRDPNARLVHAQVSPSSVGMRFEGPANGKASASAR